MATIRKLSNGKFRAEVRKQQTTLKTKTFITRSKAEDRGNKLDQQIKVTLKLQAKKLKELSPKKVEELGGKELFDKYRSSNTVIQ